MYIGEDTMKILKVATFNAEWMYSFFERQKAKILTRFPGAKLGPVRLEPISDVKSLCKRIGKMFDQIDADVIAIQEGPQLKEQMELFVRKYMKNRYKVFTQSKRTQNIHILVDKKIGKVKQYKYTGKKMEILRKNFCYYPWGKFMINDRKEGRIYRTPVVIELAVENTSIILAAVHLKSKYSKLKTSDQWIKRDKTAVLDALNARQKISAEIWQIRQFLRERLSSSMGNQPLIIMGDFNDGPFADIMEHEFLIHNIIDEIQGGLLEPDLRIYHTMTPTDLSKAYSTIFKDPFSKGNVVSTLIDHIFVSRGIAEKTSKVRIKSGSAKIESYAYNSNTDETKAKRARELRPSDHVPISVELKVYQS